LKDTTPSAHVYRKELKENYKIEKEAANQNKIQNVNRKLLPFLSSLERKVTTFLLDLLISRNPTYPNAVAVKMVPPRCPWKYVPVTVLA